MKYGYFLQKLGGYFQLFDQKPQIDGPNQCLNRLFWETPELSFKLLFSNV